VKVLAGGATLGVMTEVLLVLAAALSGSIPFGYLIGRARGIDIRQHGSKNIGATNVGRVLGRPLGVACFVLDLAKGLLPTLGAGWVLGVLGDVSPDVRAGWWWMGVMAGCVLGHMFSPWVGFKGGKGVATGFGALLGIFPVLTVPAVVVLFVWLMSVKITRYVGLSSCVAAVALPVSVGLLPVVLGWGVGEDGRWVLWPQLVVGLVLASLVVYRHRGNLARTWAGTEFRVGEKRAGG
jgi:acyl phosphate:glycerol-3-phosphate acyltransferase